MTISVATIERRARYLMGAVSISLLVVLFAWKAGWIRGEQTYNDESWYAVTQHSGFIVTSEYQDEDACRRYEEVPGSCHSGKELIAEQAKNATSIERS